MEELKIHGKYKKEDGKKIMRIINEIKLRGMQLARIVDENDMPIIVNIIAGRLLQYSVEKGIERGDKMMGEIEDRFLHGMMLVERDNTHMTVEEFLKKISAEYDTITILGNGDRDGLYCCVDKASGVPEKFRDAPVDRVELEGSELLIFLAGEE